MFERHLPLGCAMLFLVIGFAVPGSRANEWRGFRGLEKEGLSDSTNAVSQWGKDRNIRWKTPIEGAGYSSPAVAGGRVYVTTAYETNAGKELLRLIYATRAALVAALLLVTTPLLFRAVRDLWWRERTWAVAAALMALSALLALCALFDVHLFAFARCPIRVWLTTTTQTVMFVATIALLSPAESRFRRLLGAALVGFALIVAFLVPVRDHAWRTSGWDSNCLVMLTASALPAFVGWRILKRRFFPAQPPMPEATSTSWRREMMRAAFLCAAVIAAGAGALVSISTVPFEPGVTYHLLDYLSYHLSGGKLLPIFGWWSVAAFVAITAAWITACVCLPALRDRSFGAGPRRFQHAVALALAVLVMIPNIYLNMRVMARAIVCLDAENGAILWQYEGFAGPVQQMSMNSPATPTPVVGADEVCAYFGSAGLMCVDLAGHLRWENRELPFESPYGAGASPVLRDGVLVLACDMPAAPYLCALDVGTGRLLWKQTRPPTRHNEGCSRTPLIKDIAERATVLHWDWQRLAGYDLRTGEMLWSHPTAFVRGDMVTSLTTDARAAYLTDPESIRALEWSPSGPPSGATIWRNSEAGANCCSSVIARGMLFVVSDDGDAACIDTRDGKLLWSATLDGQYLASVVSTGSSVLFTSNDGVTTVVAAEPKLRKIAENRLEERVYGTPALAGARVYIRTEENLFCIEAM